MEPRKSNGIGNRWISTGESILRLDTSKAAQPASHRSGLVAPEDRLLARRGFWGVVAAIGIGLVAWLITGVTVAMALFG